MDRLPLTAEPRTETGKGPAGRFRRTGRVPGVVYGRGTTPVPLTVDAKELATLVAAAAGGALLIDLALSGSGEGQPTLCIVKETQRDPLSRAFLNVDFQSISLTQPLSVTVPIVGEGEPAGVEEGGILQQQTRDLQISCLPMEIPDTLSIDISGIAIGQSLHVSEIAVPEGITVETDLDEVVFLVSAPSLVEEEPEEGEGLEGEEGEAVEGEEQEKTEEGDDADEKSGDD